MDNQERGEFYRMSKYLNEPKRILGFTYDEFFPALGVMMFAMLSSYLLTGIMLSVGWVLTLKLLKRKLGMAFMVVGIYWYSAESISRLACPNTPPAQTKYWLN